jgi:hypothetical protein
MLLVLGVMDIGSADRTLLFVAGKTLYHLASVSSYEQYAQILAPCA